MIYWAQLLHFYQPPTQSPSVLRKIYHESYKPLLEVLLEHPQARITVNINGVLTEMLHDFGHDDIIDGLKLLVERGQIELTGSGKYHPILPLIPRKEVERQIKLNSKTNKHFFNKLYQPEGFFPPEMCYSSDIIPPIINSGHQWIVLSGIAAPDKWPLDVINYIQYDDKQIKVLFRDDIISNKISFQAIEPSEFLDNLKKIKGEKEKIYVVTAMDAETFGHHIEHWEDLFLAEVYEQIESPRETLTDLKQATDLAYQHSRFLEDDSMTQEVQAVTISQLMEIFPPGKALEPRASSWSTSDEDLAEDNPYPLWMDKNNEIHRLQWAHIDICLELVDKAIAISDNSEAKKYAAIARGMLDRALHSCQFWWASRRPMWDINLIHKGLLEQWQTIVNAYRAINVSHADEAVKKECYYKLVIARDLRDKITDSLFF